MNIYIYIFDDTCICIYIIMEVVATDKMLDILTTGHTETVTLNDLHVVHASCAATYSDLKVSNSPKTFAVKQIPRFEAINRSQKPTEATGDSQLKHPETFCHRSTWRPSKKLGSS